MAARGDDANDPYNPADVTKLPLSVPIADAEHRIEASLRSTFVLVDGLTFDTGIGVLQAWNYALDKGKNFFDVQLYIGLSFDPVRMFTD